MHAAFFLLSFLELAASPEEADPVKAPLPAILVDMQDVLDNGPPDGVSASFFPRSSAQQGLHRLTIASEFAGATYPLWDDACDVVLFGASVRSFSVRTHAFLPDDHVALPSQWWDPEVWAAHVHDLGDGQLIGFIFGFGSPGDEPFESINELNISATLFYRKPMSENTDWLIFLNSSRAGQLGHFIPLPGIAYEFRSEHWRGAIGLPTSRLIWTPNDYFEWENMVSLLTDMRSRLVFKPIESLRLFGGFAWENQSWFRADRTNRRAQFFYFQKKIETGVGWDLAPCVRLEASGGWAFDRYFAEGSGWTLPSRNRIDVSNGPFVGLQAILRY